MNFIQKSLALLAFVFTAILGMFGTARRNVAGRNGTRRTNSISVRWSADISRKAVILCITMKNMLEELGRRLEANRHGRIQGILSWKMSNRGAS